MASLLRLAPERSKQKPDLRVVPEDGGRKWVQAEVVLDSPIGLDLGYFA
jgi:hypothetical protein